MLAVLAWAVPAGASILVSGGLGYYQPNDPAITSRYGGNSILTFSLGGEIPLLKRLSSRVEFELTDTRPGVLGGGRFGDPGTRDLMTIGGRLGLTGYPFSSAGNARAFYVSVGGTYRHLTDMLWVQRSGSGQVERHDTTHSVFGPYALVGARMNGFSIEASYDWLAAESTGGLSLRAGFSVPIGL